MNRVEEAETRPRPLLVLVGGPGGCGKTTLAQLLGDEMHLVHLCRDAVKAGIAASEAGRDADGQPLIDEVRSAMGGEFGQRAFDDPAGSS